MGQWLKLYRFHGSACIHQLRKPTYDGALGVPECLCPINAEGRLRNILRQSGVPKRIQHRTLGEKGSPCRDWVEARRTKAQWLEWGQFTPPEANIEKVKQPTVEQALEFFTKYSRKTERRAGSTWEKYETFINRRLLPWCSKHGKRRISDFDNQITCKNFYASWTNLQPQRGKAIVESSDVPLEPSTTAHELERCRGIFDFAKNIGWVKENYFKAPHIKTPVIPKTRKKTGFTAEEWERIKVVLDQWPERYSSTQHGRRQRQRAFAWAARLLGMRLSDITMLGPHSITRDKAGLLFIEATLIKNGSQVKIPLDVELYDMLMALPIWGQTERPFSLRRSHGTISYGAQFWFWSANVPKGTSEEGVNQIVESAAKNWSDSLTEVLKKTVERFDTPFERHTTPHSFRHAFAITALENGVPIKMVADWMGDTVATIEKHYSNQNSDYHTKSHAQFQGIGAALKGGKKLKTAQIIKFAAKTTGHKSRPTTARRRKTGS